MSSEYLDCIEEDEQGATVGLKMNAHGYAWLSICNGKDMDIGGIEDYALPPNEKGWRNAEMIADALRSWVEHTKRIHDNL